MFGLFTIVFFAALAGLVKPFLGLTRKQYGWSAAAAFIMMMVTVPEQPSTTQTGATNISAKSAAQMERDNAAEITALKKQAAAVPATDVNENWLIYTRLTELAPTNREFSSKKALYQAKMRSQERWSSHPEEALDIKDFHWSKGGFDSIMIIDRMTVTNAAPFAVKDFVVKCTHQGPSGTDMDSNTRRVYDVVPANGSKIVREINMGFMHSQAVTSYCSITGADRA